MIGVPLALAGGRAIANQLYGVKSYDFAVFGTAIFALSASSLIAAVIPARRASHVDPIAALRYGEAFNWQTWQTAFLPSSSFPLRCALPNFDCLLNTNLAAGFACQMQLQLSQTRTPVFN